MNNRIELLREQYLKGSMMSDKTLHYTLSGRHKYLFMKGWMKHSGEWNSLLRKSRAYAYVHDNMNPVIQDNELIVGQRDFVMTDEEQKEWKKICKYWDIMPHDGGGGRQDHKSLDFEKLLKVGINGLLREISDCKSALDMNNPEDMEKYNFYICAEIELNSLLHLAERYAEYAEKLADTVTGERKKELLTIAGIMKNVPANPASGFREALQSMHFYSFAMWGLYQHGHPDRYLLPYYESDINSGVITKDEAQELIDCFCLMYTTYSTSSASIGFMVGGRYPDGRLVENELTEMFLKSIEHTRTADPSIGFCVTDETSEKLLDYASKLLSKGYSHPAIYNDNAITEALIKRGVPEEDAHCYIHSCCVEITIDKKSDVWVVSPYHNVLEYFIEVLKNNENAGSFQELFEAFSDYLRNKIIEKNFRENMFQLERSHNAGEPAAVSCLIDNCLKNGKGIYRGGAIYNWTQPNFLGIANTVDSLLVIEKFVFETEKITLKQLNEILKNNFEGYENYRTRFQNEIKPFGIGDDHADELYKKVTDMISENCKGISNYRGSFLIPAAFSYNEHIHLGSEIGASPDGRLSGAPLSDGSGPVQGRDTDGPTSMLRSVTAWNHSNFTGGIAMNLQIQKNQSPDILKALIKTYLERGGIELQVSAVSIDELKDAVIHPENHKNLLVRIGGYSDYFTSLAPDLQQEFITRTKNSL